MKHETCLFFEISFWLWTTQAILRWFYVDQCRMNGNEVNIWMRVPFSAFDLFRFYNGVDKDKIVLIFNLNMHICADVQYLDENIYVQRQVASFVHNWVVWRITIFLSALFGNCLLRSLERDQMWAGWLEMVVQGLALDFSTPIFSGSVYSPQAQRRWAWEHTRRWSTWWRWSSCRRADPSVPGALRQTKYRKGQNTNEEGNWNMSETTAAVVLGRISTENLLRLTNWRDPIPTVTSW